MLEIPSRKGLAALTEATNAIVPLVLLGVTRHLKDSSVSILYSYPFGIGEFVVPTAETPEILLPSREPTLEAGAGVLKTDCAVAWLFLFGGTQRIVSFALPDGRFWIGFSDPAPLTADQLTRLQTVAESTSALFNTPISPADVAERLQRLEQAGELLPLLLRVLDVRGVFNELSRVAQTALPHDLMLLRLFSEDLARITTFARTGGGADLDLEIPNAYPAAVTRATSFDVVDDHSIHPLERDRPPAKMGMRSSLRLAIRFEDRAIGGVVFMSAEAGRYTGTDVLVARRLADHVAFALSHHELAEQLAEQARRNEALRARTTNLELLDELLTTLIDSGDLPDVFGRISTIAQKVLAHDGLLLFIRIGDGTRSRIYASSGFPPGLGETREVPPELVQNPDWDHHIFNDLSAIPDTGRYDSVKGMGFRALLRVPIRLEGQFAGTLIFLAKRTEAFETGHVLVAHRIADRLALTLARSRQVEALKRADEASERAAKLEARVRALTDELDARTGYRRVVGQSAQWRQVLTQATQVASTEATVLLLGESGTGKEVVARFLHRASAHNGGPFVALNCAALPEQLLEAELFGYERGAFTGAMQSKPGQLEQAAGGTLFLDEVGEMSLPAQAKFLRVLQEREFQRLGGTRVLRTDARIIAATNRDLQKAITQGQFREDLYYRLNVFAIRLPALRDRRDDVLPLSEAFLGEIGRGIGRPAGGISRDARQMLIDYHWPGNVRELQNILERATILCDGGLITADHRA
jgi:transcriptional regulator with GAF, ATPase, and Fis domain